MCRLNDLKSAEGGNPHERITILETLLNRSNSRPVGKRIEKIQGRGAYDARLICIASELGEGITTRGVDGLTQINDTTLTVIPPLASTKDNLAQFC